MRDTQSPRNFSKTALGVAWLRAIHEHFDGDPKILHDPVVSRLLEDGWQQLLEAHLSRADDPLALGLRSHVVLRSRYTEERLAQAVQRGITQFVILGAGFDTFAYRQPDWARDVRIFEVDHPGTQNEKRLRLQRAGLPIPANLEFVSIDFETVSLRDGLRQAGSLNFSQPTFFSCLGVLIYLTQDAVDAVFQLVASFPAGSEIAFTFSTPDHSLSALADQVRLLGEPWQSHFDPVAMLDDLEKAGFSEISILSPEQAEQTYFRGRTDYLHAPPHASIAAAIVGTGERTAVLF